MNIEAIIRECGNYIYSYALKLSCHPADAQDLAQETFIKAWKNMESLREESALKSWLASICYHEFLMNFRAKNSRKEELIDDFEMLEKQGSYLQEYTSKPEDEIIVKEEIKKLQNGCFLAMVRKLTLNQRIVFSLVDMFGMKAEDVADLLGTSILATKGLLYRARMNIDSFFSGHCNLLDIKNPCSCESWISFSQNRNKMQQETRKILNHLDYQENNYHFDLEVRKKILYLYANMPQEKPDNEWYQRVMNALK